MSLERLQAARKVLIIGGARSGKSALAERLLLDEPAVEYVATSAGESGDPEWECRVAIHRDRRPDHWRTNETLDLVGLLDSPGPPLLIDCLTVWLTRMMDRRDAWDDATWSAAEAEIADDVDALVRAFESTERRVVVVTNEVGQGVVPAAASVRRFRDQMGLVNQSVAAVSDEVAWSVAGRFVLVESW